MANGILLIGFLRKPLRTVYVTVYVRIPKMGERTQFHTLGLGKNPRKYWILGKNGIADRAYKAAALPT